MSCRTAVLAALLTAAPLILAQSGPKPAQQPPATRTATSLTGTHWTLTRLDGEAVTPESVKPAPYIELDDVTKRLSGSGGCNRLLGTYEQSGPSLRFRQVASTMMACPGDAMKHEQAFIKALDTVTSYRIRGSTLTLRDKDKAEVARFEAQAAEATP
jgi:heat shock protein HslJ